MATASSANDLVSQATDTLQSRDQTRIDLLRHAVSLIDADSSAAMSEQKRLTAKHGAGSEQAASAAARVAALKQESAAIANSLIRASTPLPQVDAQTFVVYGRILDQQGTEVIGATVTAVSEAGAAVASSTSETQGRFQVRIPAAPQTARKSAKAGSDQPPPVTANTVQLVISAKSLQQPYTYPQTLIVAAGRVSYLEITYAVS